MWILLVFLFYFISATLAVPRLHDAAAADRTRDIVDFLTAGDDIDERDPATGDTALLIAVRHLAQILWRLLLHRGANVNIGDRERNLTPLHVASAVGNPIAVRLLVQFGADVSGIHEDGLAPLHRAASGVTSQHEETVQILIEMGAQPTSRRSRRITSHDGISRPWIWPRTSHLEPSCDLFCSTTGGVRTFGRSKQLWRRQHMPHPLG